MKAVHQMNALHESMAFNASQSNHNIAMLSTYSYIEQAKANNEGQMVSIVKHLIYNNKVMKRQTS